MLELVPGDTAGTVYELGSGWGGFARALARRCPNARVVGVEASLVPWAFAALLQRVRPAKNLRFVRGDFFAEPLHEADVLVCYLFTGAMQALATRVRPKPGAVLISSTFALPGHTPETTVRAKDLYASPVYRYRYLR
ncbi:MAG: class I SAM-dependent methyltransferase [Myxococcaceae bacterium]|nr:class I SAM-dependent methyltransferase [Myxococcaceae bacterium]